jgi:hypothetical protein
MKNATRYFNKIFTILITFFLIISLLWSGGVQAHAASSTISAYEEQNVLDDLSDMTVDGEKFNVSDYSFNTSMSAQLLSFVEFCYSYDESRQDDYRLYIYVYNPQGLDFTKNETLNKIEMRFGGNSSESYSKYLLAYVNRSEKAGYEGMFYKFRIKLNAEQRSEILKKLDSNGRIYEVSGIELYSSGTNAVEYEVANTFTYSGYALGYGSDSATESTLKCTNNNLLTITLDVQNTYYRPEGTNGKNKYTQDSLHSVYFAIDNKILDTYGGLSAVHATWLDAVITPALVTGNYDAYIATKKYIGKDVSTFTDYYVSNTGTVGIAKSSELDYAFVSDFKYSASASSVGGVTGKTGFNYHWYTSNMIENELSKLNYIFYSGSDENSADSYTVKSDEIKQWMLDYTNKFGGLFINGKYSDYLFESVDDEFTEVNIKATDEYTLTSEKLGQHWWQKIFGGSYVANTTVFDNIEAIHEVESSDFKSSDELNAKNLYIAESDYSAFKSYYDTATKNDKTVFLFRYQVSDYIAEEATETTNGSKANNTNAYFFQETVNLDFDIIDVTCSTGEVDTVIACISSPKDIINDATSPVYTTDDSTFDLLDWLASKIKTTVTSTPWWVWAIIIVAVIIVLILLIPPLLNIVVSIISFIISIPSRIANAIKKRRERQEKKQEKKAQKEKTKNGKKN